MIDIDLHDVQIECRMVFLRSGSESVWTVQTQRGPELPRLVIPRHSRHAEALQTAIKQAWNVDALLLDLLLDRDGGSSCAILEIVSQAPDGPFCAATLSEIDDADLADQERIAVKKAIGDNGDLLAFSRCGWLQEAIGWLKDRERG